MPKATLYNINAEKVGEIELSDEFFRREGDTAAYSYNGC
jgi:ribosomal protein L4